MAGAYINGHPVALEDFPLEPVETGGESGSVLAVDVCGDGEPALQPVQMPSTARLRRPAMSFVVGQWRRVSSREACWLWTCAGTENPRYTRADAVDGAIAGAREVLCCRAVEAGFESGSVLAVDVCGDGEPTLHLCRYRQRRD
jgi:hypothetical protein